MKKEGSDLMRDKPNLDLEKLKAQVKLDPIPLDKKKKKFWEFSVPTSKGSKKKPRYYKKQLYRVRKELMSK